MDLNVPAGQKTVQFSPSLPVYPELQKQSWRLPLPGGDEE